ncbi:hypothetical protein KFS98_003771 [Salmonella enterica]|nr:hypothetical protein [Salmonella enterica]
MAFMSYNDTRFIRRSMSGDTSKYYHTVRKAAGVFAITPEMVEKYGKGSLKYIEDLEITPEDPYSDFRFNNKQAYEFLSKNCPELNIDDPRVTDLAQAYALYFGKDPVQKALNNLGSKFLDDDLTILLARFGSLVSAETEDQYSQIMITNLRHTYLTDLSRIN